MIYLDTSFLVPLVLPEATSVRVARFVRRLPVEELTVSHWTRVEIASLLSRKVRMGEISQAQAKLAGSQFEATISRSFETLLPDGADYNLARAYLARFDSTLRAGDALHLAMASNRQARAIYSLDRDMVKAGVRLGLRIARGIRA